jgi:hypothetical protein
MDGAKAPKKKHIPEKLLIPFLNMAKLTVY